MSKQVFYKSSKPYNIIISFIYRQLWNEKRTAPPTFFTDENEKLSIGEDLEALLMLEILPAQAVSIHKASNLLQWAS